MSDKVPPEYLTHELTHKYGGNGLHFLRDTEDGFVLAVTQWNEKGKPAQVKVARRDMLSKFTTTLKNQDTGLTETKDYPIHPDQLKEIQSLRADLDSGKRKIVNGHVV